MSELTLDEMKESARRFLEDVFASGDESALPDLIGDQFVNHEAPPGTAPGPAGIAWAMRMLASAFSEQKWVVDKVAAEGDLVALSCRHSGRHTGDYRGLAPTGRTFNYRQMHFVRFDDGLSVEHWAVRDDLALMQQLGAIPTPPTRAGQPKH